MVSLATANKIVNHWRQTDCLIFSIYYTKRLQFKNTIYTLQTRVAEFAVTITKAFTINRLV